jgi:hypothetical protein
MVNSNRFYDTITRNEIHRWFLYNHNVLILTLMDLSFSLSLHSIKFTHLKTNTGSQLKPAVYLMRNITAWRLSVLFRLQQNMITEEQKELSQICLSCIEFKIPVCF